MDIPFLNKLNTKVEPTLDISNIRLYDKGENIYIPLDGTLTADKYTILPGQAYTQMGMHNQSFYTLIKQSYNDRVIVIKVQSIWPHLSQNVKEDLHYIQALTNNHLLSQYSQLPTLLYPYLSCIKISARQKVSLHDTVIFVSEGGLLQSGKEVQSHFEGEAIAFTDCRLYALQKTSIDIQYLPLFGHCDVNVTGQKLMLKSAILQFDSPKYAHSSVIKDLKTIKKLLKGEDYSQLRHKLDEVFGRRQVIEPVQNILQLSTSMRQRTISCQEENYQPKKPLFRRVHIPRQIQREPPRQETANWCIQKINYTPVPNRQSKVKMNTSSNNSGQKEKEQPKQQQQQLQQQQQQQQQQCLPIIKSFVSPEDFQQHCINRRPTQQQKKVINKFIEFDKIMNQLMK